MSRAIYSVACLALCTLLMAACGEEDRAQTYMQRGLALYEKGSLVKARLEFKNVLKIDPKQAQAWFMLAQLDERDQNWQAAFKAYGRVVELEPSNWEARVKKGVLLLAGGNQEEALAEAEAVLTQDGTHPSALALRGAVKQARGDLDGAVADAQSALVVDPNHRESLGLLADIRMAQGQGAEAKALLERATQAHPDYAPLKLALARVHEELGEGSAVQRLLEDLVELQPKEFSHRLQLARFYAAQGDLGAAEGTLRAAVEADPSDLQRKLMLVDFLEGSQGFDAAMGELQRWIDANPDDAGLRFALAERYRKAQRLDDMEAVYRDLAERDAKGPDGLKARGKLAALMLARNRVDDALSLAEEVIKDDRQSADALLVRAAIAVERGDADQAVGDLRTLLRNDPTSLDALRLIAQAHVLKGELPLAQDALEKGILARPADSAAYLQLAELRAKSGDVDGAAQVLERLLARVPDNAAAQTGLAQIQLNKQDVVALEKTAQHVLDTRPEHPLGYYLKGLVLQARGELQESIAQFETAYIKNPKSWESVIAMARSDMALHKPEQAAARLKRLLEEQPDNATLVGALGEVYQSMGEDGLARAQYEAATRSAPGSPVAYERLARLQLARGEREAALATIQAGLDATNRHPALLVIMAILKQQSGDTEAAIAAYEEVLQGDANAEAAANNLAMLLADRRYHDPASLERARELTKRFESSEQAVYLDTAGWVQYRSGNYERAAELLSRAMDRAEVDPERQYHLGMTYLKLGRTEEARKLLAAALDSQKPFEGLEEARAALAY